MSHVLPTRKLSFPWFKEVWIWNLNQVSKLVSGPWFSVVLVKYSFLSVIPKFFGLWRSKRNLAVFLFIQEVPCLTIRYQRQAITDVTCPYFTLGWLYSSHVQWLTTALCPPLLRNLLQTKFIRFSLCMSTVNVPN